MLDVKGIGLPPPAAPLSKEYMSGLLVAYEALMEYSWARVAERVLAEHPECNVTLLPHYAVIDLGFDLVVYADDPPWMAPVMNGLLPLHPLQLYTTALTSCAPRNASQGTVGVALLVRGANCRGDSLIPVNESLCLEKLFRRYAFST